MQTNPNEKFQISCSPTPANIMLGLSKVGVVKYLKIFLSRHPRARVRALVITWGMQSGNGHINYICSSP